MIKKLKQLYSGFDIKTSIGNNAFSYEQRLHKHIHVPALWEGSPKDLAISDEIVFSEIVDGKEMNCCGLKQLIYWKRGEQHIFFMDNHNHALMFWAWAVQSGIIKKGLPLVHVDQHKDMRRPKNLFPESIEKISLENIFNYVNFELNVGNFIVPALEANLISDVIMIDSEEAFNKNIPESCILDLDIDIFSQEMKYINEDWKCEKIKSFIPKAKLITVATSPFFINQKEAIHWIKKLF